MTVTVPHPNENRYNSKSGDDNQPSKAILLSWMERSGYEVNYQSTKNDNWAIALKNPGDLVVTAGGDGTVGLNYSCRVAKQTNGQVLMTSGEANFTPVV
ncbi:hypothetical protein ACQ4N7_27175 [Nodosilinea sp. AN01ver1]|uniref:hypothetical protein n=1 Tax=Nodosilinea sp. AN01ver1 TaxID=3423362 RepID=UPI003D312A2F